MGNWGIALIALVVVVLVVAVFVVRRGGQDVEAAGRATVVVGSAAPLVSDREQRG